MSDASAQAVVKPLCQWLVELEDYRFPEHCNQYQWALNAVVSLFSSSSVPNPAADAEYDMGDFLEILDRVVSASLRVLTHGPLSEPDARDLPLPAKVANFARNRHTLTHASSAFALAANAGCSPARSTVTSANFRTINQWLDDLTTVGSVAFSICRTYLVLGDFQDQRHAYLDARYSYRAFTILFEAIEAEMAAVQLDCREEHWNIVGCQPDLGSGSSVLRMAHDLVSQYLSATSQSAAGSSSLDLNAEYTLRCWCFGYNLSRFLPDGRAVQCLTHYLTRDMEHDMSSVHLRSPASQHRLQTFTTTAFTLQRFLELIAAVDIQQRYVVTGECRPYYGDAEASRLVSEVLSTCIANGLRQAHPGYVDYVPLAWLLPHEDVVQPARVQITPADRLVVAGLVARAASFNAPTTRVHDWNKPGERRIR